MLLPALLRREFAGRDPRRELPLEYVQLRELTRQVLIQIESHGRLADILGFVENLERRLAAHEAEMRNVYYPAAAPPLDARGEIDPVGRGAVPLGAAPDGLRDYPSWLLSSGGVLLLREQRRVSGASRS